MPLLTTLKNRNPTVLPTMSFGEIEARGSKPGPRQNQSGVSKHKPKKAQILQYLDAVLDPDGPLAPRRFCRSLQAPTELTSQWKPSKTMLPLFISTQTQLSGHSPSSNHAISSLDWRLALSDYTHCNHLGTLPLSRLPRGLI